MRLLPAIAACLALAACSDREAGPSGDAAANGLANSNVVAEAAASGPFSIDCSRASGQAEQAICADRELAVMDRALSAMPSGVVDAQWIAARSECSRADDLRQCLLDLYATRIADAAGGEPKNGGIVVGPVSLRCGEEDVSALFINSEPGVVHLTLPQQRVTLPRASAASGAKYEGRVDGQPWSYWSKDREAILVRAGGTEVACEEIGRIDE